MEISKKLLKEIEEKANAFFKGPYHCQPRQYKDDYRTYVLGADLIHENGMHMAFCHAMSTAEYFVAVNPETLLALIGRIRELERMSEALAIWCDQMDDIRQGDGPQYWIQEAETQAEYMKNA